MKRIEAKRNENDDWWRHLRSFPCCCFRFVSIRFMSFVSFVLITLVSKWTNLALEGQARSQTFSKCSWCFSWLFTAFSMFFEDFERVQTCSDVFEEPVSVTTLLRNSPLNRELFRTLFHSFYWRFSMFLEALSPEIDENLWFFNVFWNLELRNRLKPYVF